ncbi:hypothetical protein TorRG33x02_050240 [Trema orientale]|uniref:Uncharacterized protein n=1 Tax=Trema orientale TaxID=63057 RepID=A0A2P5FN14_TREOI|nr:hypothetical protein TorRG33x02_050240 [Trema orientale]
MTSCLGLSSRDENNLDLPRTRRYIPPDMTQEVWNKCVDYFSSEEFRGNPETGEMQSIAENYQQRYMDPVTGIWPSEEHKMVEIRTTQLKSQASSSASSSSTQSALPCTNETFITDEVLGVRRGYRRGVGPKLKGAASTSFTVASPPRDSPVPDTERDVEIQYFNEKLRYMSSALARLVPRFHMSIQLPAAFDILPMPLPPTLPSRFRSEPLSPTSDTQDNTDQDETDLDS